MLREYHYVWRSLFIAVELGISALVFVVSYHLRFSTLCLELFPTSEIPPPSVLWRVVLLLAAVLWFTNNHFNLYQARRITGLADEIGAVVKSSAIAVLLLMTVFYSLGEFDELRSVVLVFAVLNPLVLSLFRLSVRSVLRMLRSRGYNLRRILIAGTGRTAQKLIHRIRRNPWTGLRVVGLLSSQPDRVGRTIQGIPVIGSTDEVEEMLERHPVDQVFIALPPEKRHLVRRIAAAAADRLLAVRLVPELDRIFASSELADFEGLPIYGVWENRLHGWNAFMKRALDITVALAAILSTLPLFVAIAVLVKLTSRGPIFYVQKRMGLDGRIFPIIKFRTMRAGAEERPGWTTPDDDRCTRFGRFLRRTSLDELPQLFNVLVGHMSLVGPRPERPALIEEFRRSVPRYMLRHQVKAGMTGWAQVNGWRGNTSLRKRLQYDLYYLENWSLWFDIKILALTLVRGFIHRNAY